MRDIQVNIGTKRCRGCRKTKPKDEFLAGGYCQVCARRRSKEYYRRSQLKKNPNWQPEEYLPKGKKRCIECKEVFAIKDMVLGANKCKECHKASQKQRENEISNTSKTRVCPDCGIEKPLSQFSKPRLVPCKECVSKRLKESRNKTKQRENERSNPNQTKVCRDCGIEKPLSAFSNPRLIPECKECVSKRLKESQRKTEQRGNKRSNTNKTNQKQRDNERPEPNKTRVCPDCGIEKPLSQFSKPRLVPCKECVGKRLKESRDRKRGR